MANVKITCDKLDGVMPEQMRTRKFKPGYKYCSTHMIFDIKMYWEFTRKDCLVSNGHKTDAPFSITYLSVVSRDIVRVAFLVGSLNYLDICDCDIGNTYLNTKCRDNPWAVAGT